MGTVFQDIDANVRSFTEAQLVLFVSTSPSDAAGHINLSHKRTQPLRVIERSTWVYPGPGGSGSTCSGVVS